MITIWKFGVPTADDFTIDMPRGARILSVQVQGERPFVWALVDDEAPHARRHFEMRGTGHPARDCAALPFVGTFQLHGGALVFHLFDRGES